MARGAVAGAHRDDQQDASGDSKASKRRCVQSACVPCRKRKSKCDGGTPVCATCTAVYKTECHYDIESESRRGKNATTAAATAGTKRDAAGNASSDTASSSADHGSGLASIGSLLVSLSEEDVPKFIAHVRRNRKFDAATISESWRENGSLMSPDQDLSGHLVKNSSDKVAGQSIHFGVSAGLGLVPEDETYSRDRVRDNQYHVERQGSTWTNVTDDLVFVNKLLSLYFTWCHPFYVVFSRECFIRDFNNGRDKYCCPLLVNAICAYACHLTDDPAGRTDPSNFRTAGDHFFAEAKRIIGEDETPCLTTVQALCVMSMREPSTGRESSGFSYIGRCMRMCVELGLHLNSSLGPAVDLTKSEKEVRKVTFWGCFTVDTTWSICTGRICQLPRAAITLEKPILEEDLELPESYTSASQVSNGRVTISVFLQAFTALCELLNDVNQMFYAPQDRMTASKLLDYHSKYQSWYRKLPTELVLTSKRQPEPHILVLHMFYHNAILHLFSPFIKVQLTNSNLHPSDVCIDAANKISELVRMYRQFYDFRVAHLIIPHILLSVCIIHVVYSKKNPTSYQNLVEGLQGLEDLHECHYFGARSYKIMYAYAKQIGVPWPKELHYSKIVPMSNPDRPGGTVSPPTDPLLVPPRKIPTVPSTSHRQAPNVPYSQIGTPSRRESLSMFGAQTNIATHGAPSRPGSVPAGQQIQSPSIGHPSSLPYTMSMNPYQYTQSMSSVPSSLSPTATSPTTDPADTLFWTPIPGIPGPILPTNAYRMSGPMGLDSVLQSSNMDDHLSRDGFKINDDWQANHINGISTSTTPGFSVPNSQSGSNYMHRGTSSFPAGGNGVQYQQPPPQQQGQEEYEGGWYPNQIG